MRSFVKWPGGKAQLLPELRQRMPKSIGTYVEPFAGGAALFFDRQPQQALLNDANPKLMNLYIQVRDHKSELVGRLASYETEYNTLTTISAKQDFYYQSRSIFNSRDFETNLTVQDAARFVFINKSCFNGLYREDKAGQFNAAFGWKSNIILYEEDNLTDCSSALQDALIMSGDFEDACRDLTAGDFVYLDPPYHSTFSGYLKGGFSVEDHIRLHNLFQRLTASGVYCMLSNSDTGLIKNLYAGYNIEIVPVKRNINRNGNARHGEELIITNYKSNQI